jgi:hypothetical protein
MRTIARAALSLILSMTTAYAAPAKDRACTTADIRRFEVMMGGIKAGETRTDPRFQISLHYLGTKIVAGVCHVKIRPVE